MPYKSVQFVFTFEDKAVFNMYLRKCATIQAIWYVMDMCQNNESFLSDFKCKEDVILEAVNMCERIPEILHWARVEDKESFKKLNPEENCCINVESKGNKSNAILSFYLNHKAAERAITINFDNKSIYFHAFWEHQKVLGRVINVCEPLNFDWNQLVTFNAKDSYQMEFAYHTWNNICLSETIVSTGFTNIQPIPYTNIQPIP